MLIVGSAVLAVLAVAILVFVLVQTNRHTSAANQGLTPTGFDSNNGVTVGKADAPVTLIAYEDFQCPNCRNFEQSNSAQLDAYVKAGTLKINYRPIAFLDASSSTNYSTRALNAFAAVVSSKPSVVAQFHKILFDNQPAEGTAGLTNTTLIALAVQAGAPQAAVTTAINDESYKGWTIRVTDASSTAHVTGTPYLLVNGKVVADYSAASVKAAIDAAAATTASPTPTATK
jgi:protein-disulfide isomerase